MKLYIVDAFTTQRFSGNQAGVALLGHEEEFPSEETMLALSGELKHSETVFVKPLGLGGFHLRYFTPNTEVELCGHATIAAFTALREKGGLVPGKYPVKTMSGDIWVEVTEQAVWMDMAPPVEGRSFSEEEGAELYAAYGLSPADKPEGYEPRVVSTGLCDILLPVKNAQVLERAVQDEGKVTELSQKYGVVGVHMFWPSLDGEATCHCRNFAPLYAIPEEAATGTSNGALTYYLYRCGKVIPGVENRFLQGEKMGKPSEILSRLELAEDGAKVQVGGRAVVSLECRLVEDTL